MHPSSDAVTQTLALTEPCTPRVTQSLEGTASPYTEKQRKTADCEQAPAAVFLCFSVHGSVRANDGTRTRDLLITNQLRYQLRYIGIPSVKALQTEELYHNQAFNASINTEGAGLPQETRHLFYGESAF